MDIDAFLDKERDNMERAPSPKAVIKSQKIDAKSNSIPDQLDALKQFLAQSRFKEASDLYMQVKERFTNLTKTQIEEKNYIHSELTKINDQLTNQLSSMVEESEKNTHMIENLLQKAQGYLNEGKLDVADQLYQQIKQLFDQLPDVFSEKKLRLENKIMNFFSELNIENTKRTLSDFEQKRKEIEANLSQAFSYVQRGRLDIAKQLYAKINGLYNALPQGFIYDKLLMYKQMLKLYNEAELSLEIKSLQGQLTELEKGDKNPSPLSTKPQDPLGKTPAQNQASTVPKPSAPPQAPPSQPPAQPPEKEDQKPPQPPAKEAKLPQKKANVKITGEIKPEHLDAPPTPEKSSQSKQNDQKIDTPPKPKKKGFLGLFKKKDK